MERRKWPRLPISVPVFVRGRDDAGEPFIEFGTLLNVSAGGALLSIRKHVPESALLVLEFPSGTAVPTAIQPRTRKLRARVVRTTYSANLTFYGLRFSRPLAH